MPRFVALPREAHESARIWCHRVLLHNIVHLYLPPGSCLVESEVRARLDVSRTPVREALMQLAQENFVNIIPQKGTYVSRIDMEQVLEIRYIRGCVEAKTAAEAAKRMTPERVRRFKKLLSVQRTAVKNHAFQEFMDTDDALHKLIYETAGRGGVWEFFERNNLHHYRSRILGLRAGRALDRIAGEHGEIVAALERGDSAAAEECVMRHLAASVWNTDAVLESFPEYILPPKNSK